MAMDEEIKTKKKEGWIESWFVIEALAMNEDTVKSSLENHIKKLSNVKEVLVFETKFSDVQKVDKPVKNVEVGYSQIVDVKLFAKNLLTLIKVIMLYGPSSIEIIEPNELKLKAEEIQNISNTLAALVHQFAAAGAGGIVITPEK